MIYREAGQFKTTYARGPGDLSDRPGSRGRRARGRGRGVRRAAARRERLLAAGGPDPVPGLRARGHRAQPPDRVRRAALARHRRLHGRRRVRGVQAHDGVPAAQHRRRVPARGAGRGRRRARVRHPEPAHQGLLPRGRHAGRPVLPHLALQQGGVVLKLRLVGHHHGAAPRPCFGRPRHRPRVDGGGALPGGARARRRVRVVAKNLVRGRVGRSWMAIRDRDIAAEIIGVRPLRTKLLAFGISSFYCGVAGAELVFLYLGSAETLAFDINLSFLVLFMVIIGGLGSVLGSFLGAAFIVLVPIFLTQRAARGRARTCRSRSQKQIELMIFGGLIIFFLIVEPRGLARLWQITKEKLRLLAVSALSERRHVMKVRTLWIAAAGRALVLAAPTPAARPRATRCSSRCSSTAPARTRRAAFPIANGFVDYFTLLNERDGGINGVKLAWEECETQYDTKQGVECYERLKGKSRVLVNPVQHRHHLPADPQGPGRQGRRVLDGLRHERRLRRPVVPVGVQLPDELLEPGLGRHPLHRRAGGRAREAEGQEDRPRVPQQPLRQGSQPDARGAREEVPVRAHAARGRPSRARSRRRRGSRCAG